MSLLEGWFKRPEEKEELEKIITEKITDQTETTIKTKNKEELYNALMTPDDQELNNITEASLGKKHHTLDVINHEEAEKISIEVGPEDNTELGSNYITKN